MASLFCTKVKSWAHRRDSNLRQCWRWVTTAVRLGSLHYGDHRLPTLGLTFSTLPFFQLSSCRNNHENFQETPLFQCPHRFYLMNQISCTSAILSAFINSVPKNVNVGKPCFRLHLSNDTNQEILADVVESIFLRTPPRMEKVVKLEVSYRVRISEHKLLTMNLLIFYE